MDLLINTFVGVFLVFLLLYCFCIFMNLFFILYIIFSPFILFFSVIFMFPSFQFPVFFYILRFPFLHWSSIALNFPFSHYLFCVFLLYQIFYFLASSWKKKIPMPFLLDYGSFKVCTRAYAPYDSN
jgi:hypothetical protein